ncbi:MAG: anti-sigma F factor [Ruminococcus sp.]|nr:anti-sigma F factor [Ruminococcus sp.]MCD8328757.1 anti-sigma F factor [Ruminococcus sp.]
MKKVVNEVKLRFKSASENESFSRTVVCGFALSLNPRVDELGDIKTAVSEAVTNAIVHGYRNTSGYIDMLLRIYEDKTLYIKIRDRGCGIADVKKAMEPLYTTAPEEERAGLGFAVMESFMDKLTVKSVVEKGTTVIMIKRIVGIDGYTAEE